MLNIGGVFTEIIEVVERLQYMWNSD